MLLSYTLGFRSYTNFKAGVETCAKMRLPTGLCRLLVIYYFTEGEIIWIVLCAFLTEILKIVMGSLRSMGTKK